MGTFIAVFSFFFAFPGIIFTIGFLCFGWWYLFFVVRPRQFKLFANYYQGSFARAEAVVGCLVSFTYGAHRYGIRNIANGGIENNPIRIQRWLLSEVTAKDEFFIGHTQTEDYFFRFNFGSGAVQKVVPFNAEAYRIGSDSEVVTGRIEQVLTADIQLQADLQLLFAKPWAYMAIKKERNIGRGVITKMEYIGFPHTIVEKPEDLKPYLEALERVLKAVGV